MRIQHNIMAMNAYRNYSTNTSALSKNLEKLSSGYKINRAGDDAAGLAISEKMRAQITGLETAQKNAKDGISLVQTAEGALTEVHDMLNRMVELADQSANGTYDNQVDRENLQKEVDQLREEIDRIADSANFNGINLLDGNLAGTKVAGGTDAILTEPSNPTDGVTPNEGKKATVTIQLEGTSATNGGPGAITGGTTTVKQLGDMQVDGASISALFNLKVDGKDVDWTAAASNAITAGAKIELTAKVAGNLSTTAINTLNGIRGTKTPVEVVDGVAEGMGANATKTEYELTFNFNKLADGQTIKIGDKVFELSTDGTSNSADVTNVISIKGLDLTTGKGKLAAANAIRTAINGALGGSFTVDATPATMAGAATSYTLTFKSNAAGASTSLGAIRVSSNAGDAIVGKHTAGMDAGKGTPGSFATVTYEGFDLSKLAVGDKITIGDTTIEVVKDGEENAQGGKLKLDDAKDAQKLIDAFEAAGYANGKLSIDGTTLTITDSTVGTKGEDFAAGGGKLNFVPATAASKPYTEGGLTLQIGDTSDDFNQLQVSIDDMHAEALGIDTLSIATQDEALDAVDVIKKAINTVSSVRGTLGATQNRLDHTINNLSVMTENIQDAESTIRDTDVADEMMAYTKNNILIQSAQAMLAQANQVPQGVLQLLQ